jgi:hypothetical protein
MHEPKVQIPAGIATQCTSIWQVVYSGLECMQHATGEITHEDFVV